MDAHTAHQRLLPRLNGSYLWLTCLCDHVCVDGGYAESPVVYNVLEE